MPFGGICPPFAGVDLGAAVGPSTLGQLAPIAVTPGRFVVTRMQTFAQAKQPGAGIAWISCIGASALGVTKMLRPPRASGLFERLKLDELPNEVVDERDRRP